MRVRVKRRKKLDIIVTNGHKANKTPREKDAYYKEPQQAVNETPKSHALIIAGDMNAKALKATCALEEGVIGKYAVYTEQKETKQAWEKTQETTGKG